MKNLYYHEHLVSRRDKEKNNHHRGVVLWFTGLSGSGKSTIANALEKLLFKKGCNTIILDGDNIRHGLNSDLSFSDKDRSENIRRVGEVAKLLAENGTITIVSFISPFRSDRNSIRAKMKKGDFVEVFVDCDPSICEKRDPKGLYKKARSGKIAQFTGISSNYEAPMRPEIRINSGKLGVNESVKTIYKYLFNSQAG